MIKVLHYCWFGGNPLPESAIKYIESWKRFCPDFEIKRWDETNFDIHSVPFVEEAYEAQKWAFVSDYVRTYALYNEGGLYVDTDVEFIRAIDDLLNSSFIGFENPEIVNPGLVIYACVPKQEFYKNILERYNKLHFSIELQNAISSPKIYTEILESSGLVKNNTLQKIGDIIVYPMEYFQPLGDQRYKIKKKITANTRTIHHYDASWLNKPDKDYYLLKMRHGEIGGRIIFIFRHPILALKKLFR